MRATIRLTGLASLLALIAIVSNALASDAGLITKPSRYSVDETIARFEAAVKSKAGAGFKVFTLIDHAAAAKEAGLVMRPRTVIVFGNPKVGTPVMIKTPLLAIDVPPKALVWEDDQGKVWLSYNSADYLYGTIYPRHGLKDVKPPAAFIKVVEEITDYATK
jgi:uncharacterized protein (DUF302 family)